MTLGPASANRALRLLSLPQAWSLRRACEDVQGTQEKVLSRILRQNRDTEFGERCSFGRIRSVREFQAKVPLSDAKDYREPVRRIGEGARKVLTRAPVLLLEPTSGSLEPSKWIPYTADLRKEFSAALGAWLFDLYSQYPALLDGPAYWAVTPALQRPRLSPGGIRLGFDEDAQYFGTLKRRLIRSVLAVPPELQAVGDRDTFLYLTLLFLLRAKELRLISVWNPTFLTLLLAPLLKLGKELARDIGEGRLPAGLPPGLLNPPDPGRAQELREAFATARDAAALHARLWPRLALISCWTDGAAAGVLPELRSLFPDVPVQGKGLLATEGVVSIPFMARPGAALALRSHFYEFLPLEGEGPRLAHELELGRRYSIVLTTGGGLYRYQLQDVVEVVAFLDRCPCLRFIGRGGCVSDRFGEKLAEAHAREALARGLAGSGARAAFAMLAYEERSYVLFIEAPGLKDRELLYAGGRVETDLQRNFHYGYARQLGQLGPLRVFRIRGNGQQTFLQRCALDGQRLGQIKPVALHPQSGWKDAFDGCFLASEIRTSGGLHEPVVSDR
ncbi:MAG: GH3 auxin-responsive promoter family protein [Elusimicrobiota bacterium]